MASKKNMLLQRDLELFSTEVFNSRKRTLLEGGIESNIVAGKWRKLRSAAGYGSIGNSTVILFVLDRSD